MLIVVDTNIFIGACIGTGASNRVVTACVRGLTITHTGHRRVRNDRDDHSKSLFLGSSESNPHIRLSLSRADIRKTTGINCLTINQLSRRWLAVSSVGNSQVRGEHTPLMGTALLTEYEDVLGRAELFRNSRLSSEEREELLDIFLATCRWTRIYFGWRPNLPDEGDNHLVELAVAGNAGRIITRNLRDLRGKELIFPGLVAVTPEQFCKEVKP